MRIRKTRSNKRSSRPTGSRPPRIEGVGASQESETPEVASNLRDLEADRKTVSLFVFRKQFGGIKELQDSAFLYNQEWGIFQRA
jgi:hypothetical protein